MRGISVIRRIKKVLSVGTRAVHKFANPDLTTPVDDTFLPGPGKVFLPYVPPTLEAWVHNVQFDRVGITELEHDVFNAPMRKDIVHRVVEWERAAARRETHWTPNRSEINKTGKKILPQKGSGRARHRDRYAPIFISGGKSFGPRGPRDYSYSLPKKVVNFGLRTALTAKFAEGNLFILDSPTMESYKTAYFKETFAKWGVHRPLMLYAEDELDPNFILGARNVRWFNMYPADQVPLFEILRHHELIITQAALAQTQERLLRSNHRINFVCPPLDELIATGEIQPVVSQQ